MVLVALECRRRSLSLGPGCEDDWVLLGRSCRWLSDHMFRALGLYLVRVRGSVGRRRSGGWGCFGSHCLEGE